MCAKAATEIFLEKIMPSAQWVKMHFTAAVACRLLRSMARNTKRFTPERILLIFTAFLALAAAVSVRDCRARSRLEWTVPVKK
jgi:hypothetical protein